MSIAFGAASNSGYQTANSSYSWSHTVTAGSNGYLLVGVSMLSAAGISVSSITYNGVSLTLLGSQASATGAVRAELWGLASPAVGAHTVAVTLSGPLDSASGAVSLTGVDQATTTEGLASDSKTAPTLSSPSVDVTTTADNDWVIDVVCTNDTSISVGSGQTERSNISGTLGSGAIATFGPKTPPGTVTMNWTDNGATVTWSEVAIAIIPQVDFDPSNFPFVKDNLPAREAVRAVPY